MSDQDVIDIDACIQLLSRHLKRQEDAIAELEEQRKMTMENVNVLRLHVRELSERNSRRKMATQAVADLSAMKQAAHAAAEAAGELTDEPETAANAVVAYLRRQPAREGFGTTVSHEIAETAAEAAKNLHLVLRRTEGFGTS